MYQHRLSWWNPLSKPLTSNFLTINHQIFVWVLIMDFPYKATESSCDSVLLHRWTMGYSVRSCVPLADQCTAVVQQHGQGWEDGGRSCLLHTACWELQPDPLPMGKWYHLGPWCEDMFILHSMPWHWNGNFDIRQWVIFHNQGQSNWTVLTLT